MSRSPLPAASASGTPLPAAAVKEAALACRFALVGLAPAEALPPAPLRRWLAAGHAAGMDYMARRQEERLDPGVVLPGARTVIALAIGCRRPDAERSPVARYARGRDYHYAHRDGMKALRKRLLALGGPGGVETYACVDTGVAMEKVWAERAGLGWIGKNGMLINPRHGSWLTLSVMFLDRAVDRYDRPHPFHCGECVRCLRACPTKALPEPGVVDARRCLAYHSIEHQEPVPERLRRAFRGRVFGCDVCQDVCPFDGAGTDSEDPRVAPRSLGLMTPVEMLALDEGALGRMAVGTAMARAGARGLRRNAALALGAARDASARRALEDAAAREDPVVAGAARWALGRLPG